MKNIFPKNIFGKMSFDLGPAALSGDNLPTKSEVYQYLLYLEDVKKGTGEWNRRTTLTTKAQCVADDVAAVWDKAGIPHKLDTDWYKRERQVEVVLTRARALKKVPAGQNKTEDFLQKVAEMQKLFDVAKCQCNLGDGWCSCARDDQVPSNSKQFLIDQRSERKLTLSQIDRAVSLRSGAVREAEDRKRREEMTAQMEQEQNRAEKRQRREEKKMDEEVM